MNDRELLELAAKAAGMSHLTEWSDFISDYDSAHYGGAAMHASGIGGECKSWNPLTDDGDALRLAVKLDMLVDAEVCASVICPDKNGGMFHIEENHEGDKYAAARRAIVRAAAEIGRAM